MIEYVSKGKYKVTVDCGFINGKRKRISQTITGSKLDAKALEVQLKYSKNLEVITPNTNCTEENTKYTFTDLANKYIEDYCKIYLKENTIYGYNNLLKVINKELGNMYLSDITMATLEKYYNDIKIKYGYSSNTLKHHYVLINSIFSQGIKWQIISSNPNQYVTKPKIEKKEAKIYNFEQIDNLLKALENEPIAYRAPIILCLDTGMRREELNGLTWEDINFSTNEIRINKVRIAVGKEIIITTPKTEMSNRTIIASKIAMDNLKELKDYQNKIALELKNQWHNTGYVFVNDNGIEYYPDTLYKIFKKVQKKYGLDNLSLHELRHTSASLLINKNVDIATVSTRLGHANKSTTLNMYTHTLDTAKIKAANTMNCILSNI